MSATSKSSSDDLMMGMAIGMFIFLGAAALIQNDKLKSEAAAAKAAQPEHIRNLMGPRRKGESNREWLDRIGDEVAEAEEVEKRLNDAFLKRVKEKDERAQAETKIELDDGLVDAMRKEMAYIKVKYGNESEPLRELARKED